MSKIFDVDDAPGSPLQIVELDQTALSELIGRDFIINRVRAEDEIFEQCDIARLEINNMHSELQLIFSIQRDQQTIYSVPLYVVTHAGFDLWMAGTDGENRSLAVFAKPDGLSPDQNPCARLRILVFVSTDTRNRPSQYQYTEATTKPAPVAEPPCGSGGQILASEDDESEGYHER